MIEITNLSKSYNKEKIKAVDDLNLTIAPFLISAIWVFGIGSFAWQLPPFLWQLERCFTFS